MKVNFIFSLIVFTAVACTNTTSEKESIRTEQELLTLIKGWSRSDSLKNPEVMKKYTLALDEFLANYPESPEHENFLFLAANNAGNLGNYEDAAFKFARFSEKYPTSRSHPESLIAAGFLYNNEVHNLDSARKYYETFILLYPEHDYAEDIKSELANLGKTPEEMLDAVIEQDSAGN
ncbi:MAG: tetratricopeptide repeat protein [Bacteroidia bacterium]